MSLHVNYTPEEFLSMALSSEAVNAERRGAVKALREAANDVLASEWWTDGSDNHASKVRSWLRSRADQIEEDN